MIEGNYERRVLRYLPIDRSGEGVRWVQPEEGEEFIGVPYGNQGDNSEPFIIVRVGGVRIKTINALDLSEIVFVDPPAT